MAILNQSTTQISFSGGSREENPPILDINRIQQIGDYWCYAACGQMIATYLKIKNLEQCDIVNTLLRMLARNDINACSTPKMADIGCPPGYIVDLYGQCGISCSLQPRALDPSVLEGEIKACRPVLVLLNFTAGGSHVMVVSGFDNDGNVYTIDTRRNHLEGFINYNSLITAQHSGSWDASWLNFGFRG
jgi:hypothetical protein